MATEKEIRLVEQLLDKTRKRILSWEPTALEDELLSTLGGTVSFTLSGGALASDLVLVVRDERDCVLLTVNADEVRQVVELHAEVRRQAVNVDEFLDDVLDQLAKLDQR